jgi:glycosyltransferase involved in cell wall biosynthesis
LKIFYDGFIFTAQKFGGINRIFSEIICRLDRRFNDVQIFKFKIPKDGGAVNRLYFVPKIGKLLRGLDGLRLGREIKRILPDIYHPTYYRLAEPGQSKLVVSVYDMIHEKFSSEIPKSNLIVAIKRACVKRADVVIAISEATKRDVVDYYGIKPEKVVVVHLAASDEFMRKTVPRLELKINPVIPRDYLLYVGNRNGYKNFKVLMESYGHIQRRTGLSLVCVGGGNWNKAEMDVIRDFHLADKIFNYQGLDDCGLKELYSMSRIFVYPSIYEGFGIPLLEAMACGSPVVAACSSSIPEVAGDAAEYFDPIDPDALSAALLSVNEDTEKRQQMILRGRERAAQFSWDITTEKIYNVYKSVL